MKRLNNILCVIEPDSHSDSALAHAVKIANDNQAKITIATVNRVPRRLRTFFNNADELHTFLQESTNIKRIAINDWVKKIQPDLQFTIEVYTAGIGSVAIIQSVVKNQYDLLIKCADDVNWLSRLFDSDDMQLLRKCPCPVLMLKPDQGEKFRKVLATVDVNDDFNENDENGVQDKLNNEVLDYSAMFSVSQLSELHIGSVWDAYGESFLRHSTFSNMSSEKIDDYAEQARHESSNNLDLLVLALKSRVGKETLEYLNPQIHLIKGRPSVEIPLMVKKYDIDLIVMGTVARTGVPGFIIGNTAESILEQVQCSVLAIKPANFVTPIQQADV